jgi:phosphotransacetylase
MPESQVAGRANILIVPDINAGNILYKSLEQFAGAHVAGPILLGFNYPISDLSRGSTTEDIVITTKYLLKLI